MDVSNTINSQSQANSPLAAKMLGNREPNISRDCISYIDSLHFKLLKMMHVE